MHEFDFFVGVVTLTGCGVDLPATCNFGPPFELSPFDGHWNILLAAVAGFAAILTGFAAVDGDFRSELLRLGHVDLPFRMRRLRDLHQSLPTRKDIGRIRRKLNRLGKRSGLAGLEDL